MTIDWGQLRRIQACLVIAATLSVPFAGRALAATPPDTLVQAWAIDDIIGLDPAEAFEISAGEMLGNSYDRLVRLDIDDPSQLVNDLAEEWQVSEDGRTFTFTLRDGMTFASGNPITADDVAWSIQRAVKLDKSPAFILTQFGLTPENVESRARATDARTFVFETDQAYAPSFVLNCLTANVAAVVDRQLVEAEARDGDFGNGWLRTHYAGSGPMTIRDWRPNEILVLERNERYHGEQAKLTRVIYRNVRESATQRLMLQSGDIDVARNLQPNDLDQIANLDTVRVISAPKGTIYYFSLNQKHPELAKPEVREAFKYLVDYDGIQASLIKGIGEIHQNFLPKGMLGASEESPYHLDVDKAKSLLAEAGLGDGFSITMDVRNTQPVTGIAESVQQTMAEAGVRLEIIPGDGAQTLTKYRARSHDMYIGQWGVDYWDPHTNADTFASNPDNADDSGVSTLAWRNSWDIPELTQESRAAVLESDTDARIALYDDLQRKVREQGPYVFLFQQTEVAAVANGVQGYRLGPSFDTNYVYNVSKE